MVVGMNDHVRRPLAVVDDDLLMIGDCFASSPGDSDLLGLDSGHDHMIADQYVKVRNRTFISGARLSRRITRKLMYTITRPLWEQVEGLAVRGRDRREMAAIEGHDRRGVEPLCERDDRGVCAA